MGRLVKNLALQSGSYAIRMPVGDNLLGPQSPVDGQARFNAAIGNLEVYFNSAWHGMGFVGKVEIVKDTHTGDSVQTDFLITQSYAAGHEAEMLVFIGGVFQNPGINYTVASFTLTFTSAPDIGLPIIVLHNFNSTNVQ